MSDHTAAELRSQLAHTQQQLTLTQAQIQTDTQTERDTEREADRERHAQMEAKLSAIERENEMLQNERASERAQYEQMQRALQHVTEENKNYHGKVEVSCLPILCFRV